MSEYQRPLSGAEGKRILLNAISVLISTVFSLSLGSLEHYQVYLRNSELPMIRRHIPILLLAFISTLGLSNAQNNPPVAVTDYDTTDSGGGALVWVLTNDTDPDGNILTIDTAWHDSTRGSFQVLAGIVIDYDYDNLYYGVDTIYYVVCDDTIPSLCDTGLLVVTVNYKMYEAYEFLDLNNISALFNASTGGDFWNIDLNQSGFEVPKGSGKGTIFTAGLWIAGLNADNSLHLAAQTYRDIGQSFYSGPIMDSSQYSFSQDSLWNRLWKINKSEIDTHRVRWDDPGYTMPEVILNWPAHGDVSMGQANDLAPYFDVDGNNVYDPMNGDYPKIKGDQAIYFIRNDDRSVFGNLGGVRMKIEIHGMAYAFNCSNDLALNHCIFVNYKIVNKSTNNYDSTYIGINFDPDIGDFTDDFIECDVKRGSVFAFNGTAIDGTGAPEHYGASPPAQSLVYLKGPLMDADGFDNPGGGCDESINGVGFGDGIVDNEHLGMSNFTAYCNPGPGCNSGTQGDPDTSYHYYNFLRGSWKDGTRMKYGGNGHVNNCTSCEYANFMYPNTSDSCNWGVCSDPDNQNCGVTPSDSMPWNEENALNFAWDRRGISSIGPFTFNAGDTIEMDIAYVYGRDMTSSDPYSSVIVMKENIDSVRSYFNRNLTPCGSVFTSIEPQPANSLSSSDITVYPNPATGFLNVLLPQQSSEYNYIITDLAGRNVQSGLLRNVNNIDIRTLGHGIFILRIRDEDRSYHGKFVKM